MFPRQQCRSFDGTRSKCLWEDADVKVKGNNKATMMPLLLSVGQHPACAVQRRLRRGETIT